MYILESIWIGLYDFHDPSPAVEGAPRNAYKPASFIQVVSGIYRPTSYLMVVSNNKRKRRIESVFLGCSRRRGDSGTGGVAGTGGFLVLGWFLEQGQDQEKERERWLQHD